MMHDPEIYPDPERFEPERYLTNGVLDPDAPDPGDVAFGFGRRYDVCSRAFQKMLRTVPLGYALERT